MSSIAIGSSSFLATISWVGAVILLMVFIYVPAHAPLTLNQSIVAWVTSAVIGFSSVVAVHRAGSLSGRIMFGLVAMAPCLLAIIVVIGLLRQ